MTTSSFYPKTITISVEHAGNRLLSGFADLFVGSEGRALLQSHRGYDPGASAVAAALARRLRSPIWQNYTTRLLIDLNRSIGNRNLFSPYSRALASQAKTRLLDYYRTRRSEFAAIVAAAEAKGPLLHLSVHSFTPVLDGVERNCEIGLLYDPTRDRERELALAWQPLLEARGYRVRRNYPYRGRDDGHCSYYRRKLTASHYVGLEIELNQALFPETESRVAADLAATLRRLIAQ